ncbi:hypothetical protein [Winogradskyella forsetii]|uniref:hypothetical protein n=1 Tax=Winogradskyella forsetii TaxID=2686077 RepID=UPI0015C84ECD|nr:hypothetical protein [Winogradskyella forsetii]
MIKTKFNKYECPFFPTTSEATIFRNSERKSGTAKRSFKHVALEAKDALAIS